MRSLLQKYGTSLVNGSGDSVEGVGDLPENVAVRDALHVFVAESWDLLVAVQDISNSSTHRSFFQGGIPCCIQQLETDSLGGSPVLRRFKDDKVLRPADANASTVRALEQRGLIRPAKSRDPLTIAWRLNSAEHR